MQDKIDHVKSSTIVNTLPGVSPTHYPISIYNTCQQLCTVTSSHEINNQIDTKCLEQIALSLQVPNKNAWYRSLSCHCNDCNACLYKL